MNIKKLKIERDRLKSNLEKDQKSFDDIRKSKGGNPRLKHIELMALNDRINHTSLDLEDVKNEISNIYWTRFFIISCLISSIAGGVFGYLGY